MRASALALIGVLIGLAGTSTSALAGPKPDPPPIKRVPPPPPPAYRPPAPPPPAYVPPPPPPAIYHAPPSGPTAAQILASKRAAAQAQAAKRAQALRLKHERRKKQRLKKQRRAARLAAARRRAQEAWLGAAAERPASARQVATAWRSGSDDRGFVDTNGPNVQILALTALGAFLILSLGLVPSTTAPRSRISAALEEHRAHFALIGGMVLLSVAVFSALTLLTN
jgi:type IV secretory pathway VirB10-like protein